MKQSDGKSCVNREISTVVSYQKPEIYATLLNFIKRVYS